jgi:tetratricopeptide (TPR) repeat protein
LGDYSEAIRLNPKDPMAFLGRGVLLAGRKRLYERAIDDFDKVLVLAPDNVDGLMRRGDAYSQMGKFGPALADLDRAVAMAPDNAEAYVYRGLANSRRNDNKLALIDYTAGLARDSENVDALVNRAAIYSTNGEQALAIADLDAAIVLKKDDPLAFYNRGYAHFANRQYDLAAADYTSAIGLDPNMGLAYTNRCLTRTIVGKDLVGALGDCDKALKLMPNNAAVHETRAFTYLKMGEAEIAIQEFGAALEIKPDQPLSLYGRGLARVKAGHTREGAADKASALALDPAIARQFSVYGVE